MLVYQRVFYTNFAEKGDIMWHPSSSPLSFFSRPELCLGADPKMFRSPRVWAPEEGVTPKNAPTPDPGWIRLMTFKYMGMDQYLYIPFLGGWTSIYQLFWCSPGVQGFDTLPYVHIYSVSPAVGVQWSTYKKYHLQKTKRTINSRGNPLQALIPTVQSICFWVPSPTLPVSASMMASTVRISRPPKSCDATSAHCR